MKKLVAALIAISMSIPGAWAQKVANPSQVVPNFNPESIGPILTEIGVTWRSQVSPDGQVYIQAIFRNEINFILAPTACNVAGMNGCIGLAMVALFDGQVNPQTVTAFNDKYTFANAGIDQNGNTYLRRYDIADYGIPRGNIESAVTNFAVQSIMFRSHLHASRRTVALQGYADDLSAASLNRSGLNSLTGGNAHSMDSEHSHQISLDEVAALVGKFTADESAPRNKIDNKF